jgi:hypothetical protein
VRPGASAKAGSAPPLPDRGRKQTSALRLLFVRRLSYLVPTALLVSVVVYARPSWWAVALLVGGAKFGWDWLWGDRRLLLASYGLRRSVIGCVLIVLGVLLAQGLGISMAELHETARGLGKASVCCTTCLPSASVSCCMDV